MKKIALGVASSIGLYKACEVVRGFQKSGFQVQVIMTRNATRLITPALFGALSGLDPIVDLFDSAQARDIGHIELAREVDLLCIAPATANVIGKLAGGVADDFLSTFFLAARSPVVVAPAMNEAMYLHPQTQANIARLKSLGVEFVEPDKGYLACGDVGWGRLADPDKIVRESLSLMAASRSLSGKTVLVTAGPTREFLDAVRFLSNPSTGKMGYEMAREARRRGAEVVLISGPTSLLPPAGVTVHPVVTAAEMEARVLESFPKADIVVMAAAVSDFRFRRVREGKVRKQEVGTSLAVERTPDILARLGREKTRQFLVGFAAETEDVVGNARAKMAAKGADLMVANSVRDGRGFAADDNEVRIIPPRGKITASGKRSKREVARLIFDRIEESLEKERG